MICRNCGQEIPSGKLHCEYCGEKVRIVPDYSPLEDALAAQVKGAIDGRDDYEYRTQRLTQQRMETQHFQHTRAEAHRQETDSYRTDRARARRQAERRRALKRRRRRKALLILSVCVLGVILLSFLVYQNSYSGQVKKGYKATANGNYTEAEKYFTKAISKKSKRAEAYEGLSKVYLAQNDKTGAEEVFINAIENEPNSADIYEGCIQLYLDMKENDKIAVLLDNASNKVKKALADYIIAVPKFSLDDSKSFDDVQQLSLESEYTVYYTLDGSEPTLKSTQYKDPIQLSEGETVIKAIAVTKEGIPSVIETKTYTVELPMEDAPAISPSTGQYSEATKITIKVPEGYTAYYTMDKSTPTEESALYTEPIDMPEGSTIFKAVLVNGKGKCSAVTTRNYELTSEE